MTSPDLLGPTGVAATLPRIAPGLTKYQRIQAHLHEADTRAAP